MRKQIIFLSLLILNQLIIAQEQKPSQSQSGQNVDKFQSMCFLKLGLDYSNVKIKYDGVEKIAGQLTVAEVKKYCSNSFEGEVLTKENTNASFNVGYSGLGASGELANNNVSLKKFAVFYKQVSIKNKSDDKIIGTLILGYGYVLDVKFNSKEKSGKTSYISIASLSASKNKIDGVISFSKFGIPVDKFQPTFPSIGKIDDNSLQLGTSMLENAKIMINNAVSRDEITPRLTVIGFTPINETSYEDLYAAILEINSEVTTNSPPNVPISKYSLN